MPPKAPAEPASAAEALIDEAAPPPIEPRAATKDDKAIEAVGAKLGVKAHKVGKQLSNVSPLAGATLAVRAEDGAAALARVVGKFFPGLLRAGGNGMILFDVVTVLTSVTALGVAALVDAGRLPADHPSAQRLGITELAAQLAQKQALHSQQLAQAQAGIPGGAPLDAQQYAWLQNQMVYQHQAQQAYAQQQAVQRAQAQAYNATAGLSYPFSG